MAGYEASGPNQHVRLQPATEGKGHFDNSRNTLIREFFSFGARTLIFSGKRGFHFLLEASGGISKISEFIYFIYL